MIFFTSDEHYGHANIISYCNRPFVDTNEMREALIERHNAVVKPEDEVWHLGDFSFEKHSFQGFKDFVSRLNGTHRLIAGNHDSCFMKHRNACDEIYNYMAYGFKEVNQLRRLSLPGLGEVLLSHLPCQDNGHDSRYQEFAPHKEIYESLGISWVIHGHVHGAWKIRDRMINVGVDVWNYTPVSLEELVATVTAA